MNLCNPDGFEGLRARRSAELERLPYHLRPLLDVMHSGARWKLVSALSDLVLPATVPVERLRGMALGMINAAKIRDELSESAADALSAYVLALPIAPQ
ncbi:hypothetical protein H8F21_14320 [Pseudomonas sp. P66]|uniref:Uncharacterized protein n=1 Tax=Pseudomonas arcuscaelestis TaxID=2710591 RepID=A0ABS2BYR7_9PSED|nr:hypothetical protein [Pseudomonas arcuscaelestis]MBM5458739.1 hypothetical protein [Pseudomonas arcuscaelestis]